MRADRGAVRAGTTGERSLPTSVARRASGSPVAGRLRQLRHGRQLTQRQLADRARISLECVWTIENGRKLPRRSTALLLAQALGVPLADLLAGGGARRPRPEIAATAGDTILQGCCPPPPA